MGNSIYYTDEKSKAKIDKLLFKNAELWANLYMNNSLDVGSRAKADRIWRKYAEQIRKIDEEFYRILEPEFL